MGSLTKKEKELWSEAVRQTTKEIKNWDGLIPNIVDREFMSNSIYERLAYKIKHREYF